MSISSDVNQIHKTLFINSAANELEDIEDEKDEDIFNTATEVTPGETEGEVDDSGNLLTSDEGLSLIQASKDYIDAVQSIATNPWDYNSWQVYLEEVEQGRGGATSVAEAYIKFLDRYPFSAKIYKRLADYYYHTKNDIKQAETVYQKCLNSCRSVTLYYDYLNMLKATTLDRSFHHKKDSSKSGGSGNISSSSSMLDNESQYNSARNLFETAIEKSIEHVGMAIDANSIWRVYIDFIKDYPEMGTSDPGRKLQNLRKIYQRTICIPMMDLETFWKEYEVLEKSAGEHLAERVLPEYREKYNHAKAIFKEREKLTSSIMFERLAIPPALPPLTLTQQQQSMTAGSGTTTGSSSTGVMTVAAIAANNNIFYFESHQLDNWTKWIKYELSNPDQLPLEGLKNMMTYIYKKCLCCFRYHAEVWLNYSGFEYNIDSMIHDKNIKATVQSSTGNTATSGTADRVAGHTVAVESRAILVQGIEVLPEVATLQVALAELEEKCHFINIINNNVTLINGNNASTMDTAITTGSSNVINSGGNDSTNTLVTSMNLLMARNILREAFEVLPSPYTFTVYQRFLRRHEGIVSARRLFSETSQLRLEKKLGCEIYLAHAQLECEVNCQPAVASRVLALAMNDDSSAISNIHFIRYYIKVLLLLGDIHQIRWLSFTALGRDPLNFTSTTGGSVSSGGVDSVTIVQSNLEQTAKDEHTLFSSPLSSAPPLHRYLVWQDLYHAEATLCQCNVMKLEMIKKYTQEAKRMVEETMSHTHRTGNSGDKVMASNSNNLLLFSSFVDSTRNIFDKYPVMTITDTTPDMLLKTRMQYYSGSGNDAGLLLEGSSSSGMEEHDLNRQQQQHLMSGSAAGSTGASSSVTRRSQHQQQSSRGGGGMRQQDRDRDRGDRGGGDKDRDQQRGQVDRESGASGTASGASSSSTSGVSFEALTQILSFIPVTAASAAATTDSSTAAAATTPVSQLMRDFLSKLPVYSGPPLLVQELDQFVYHFRNLILPLRPLVPASGSAVNSVNDDTFFMPENSGSAMSGGGYNQEMLRERESVGYGSMISNMGNNSSTGVDTEDYYDEYISPPLATTAPPYQQQQQGQQIYSMESVGNNTIGMMSGGVGSGTQHDEEDGNSNVFRQRRKDIKRRRE